MTAREKLALRRLKSWIDNGQPTLSLTQIWPKPIELAKDIHALIELVESKKIMP